MFEACCHWNHGKSLHPLHRDWDVDSPSICAHVHLPILDHSACCFDTLCSVCEYGWRSGELGGSALLPAALSWTVAFGEASDFGV